MGIFSNIFGGGAGYSSPGPTAVAAAQTTSEGFELQKPFIEDIFTTAQAETFDIDDDGTKTLRGFEQFTGPRIADFQPEQQEALSGLAALGRTGLAGTDLAASPQYFQAARDALDQAQGRFGTADAERLMNPFLDQVIDVQKREAQRRFESVERPKLDAEAVAQGSFGGSRAGLLQAEANRNLQRRLDDMEAKGRLTAFEQAQKAFEAEKKREADVGRSFAALGSEIPAQAAKELGLLSSVGEVQQAQTQKALDLAEADFIRERDFPMRQLQEYQSLVRGFPFTPSTYEVKSDYEAQPTFGQQLLSAVGQGAGLFGAFGGFSPGRQAGGQVVPRQSGGQVRGGLASLERHQNNLVHPDNVYGPLTKADILRQRPLLPSGGYHPSYRPNVAVDPMAGRDRTSIIDTILSLFGSEQIQSQNEAAAKRMQPRYEGGDRSDLPSVIRVGETGPGEGDVLVEGRWSEPNIREAGFNVDDVMSSVSKNISGLYDRLGAEGRIFSAGALPDPFPAIATDVSRADIVNEASEKYGSRKGVGDAISSRTGRPRGVQVQLDENLNVVPGSGVNTEELITRKYQESSPNYHRVPDAFTSFIDAEGKNLLDSAPSSKQPEKKAAPEKEPTTKKSKTYKPSSPVMQAYADVDKAFDAYMDFLNKKQKSKDERISEAQDAKERNLWLALAEGSAKLGSDTGPGGLLSKIGRSIPYKDLKKIQSDFRKEVRAAKDIEEDVLKGKLSLNMGRAKLRLEREKLDIERMKGEAAANLANAKAAYERSGRGREFEAGLKAIKIAADDPSGRLHPQYGSFLTEKFLIYLNSYPEDQAAELAIRDGRAYIQNEQKRGTGSAQKTIDSTTKAVTDKLNR